MAGGKKTTGTGADKTAADKPIEDAEVVSETGPGGKDSPKASTGAGAAKEAVKDGAETAKDTAKTATKTAAKSASGNKTASKTTSKSTTKAASASTSKAATADAAKDAGKDTAASAAKDTAKDAAETAESSIPKTGKSAASTASAPAPAPAVKETVVVRKGGFFPTVLGGIVAAGIGFGAAQLPMFQGLFGDDGSDFEAEATGRLDAADARIAGLEGQIEEVAGMTDTSELQASVAGNSDAVAALEGAVSGEIETLSQSLSGLETQIADLGTRLGDLEKRPVTEAVSPEAIAAYERELESMRETLERQRNEISAAIDEQRGAVDEIVSAARAEAEEMERNAEDARRQTVLRTALSGIGTALQTGAPFADELSALSGATDEAVPEVLSAKAESGVATLSALQASFPDAARSALAAARSSETAPENGSVGIGGFLQKQLGVRSLEPREGNSVDAILSRAEAAVRGGDLDAALSEIGALPDGARTELEAWAADAQARQQALSATDTLSDTLLAE